MNLLGEVVGCLSIYSEAIGFRDEPLKSDQRRWGGHTFIIQGADKKDMWYYLHGLYEEVLASCYVGCVSPTAASWVVVCVNVDEDILTLQFVRWSNNVNRDSEDPLLIPPGLELDLYKLLHNLTIFGRQMLEVMDILSMLVASDDGGVLEHSEPVIPSTCLDDVERLVPPPFVPEGNVPPDDHEMKDMDDEVLMVDCLTRKRTRASKRAGGSDYDDAEKTIDVVVDVASGSRSSKKKKTKKIVSDASGASWSRVEAGPRDQVAQGVPLGRQGGGSGVFGSASKGDIPVTHEDHAFLFQTGLRASDACTVVSSAILVDIVHEYAYLRSKLRQGHRTGVKLTKGQRHFVSVRTEKLDLETQVKRLEKQLEASIMSRRMKLEAQTLKASEAEVAQQNSEKVVGLRRRIAELEVEIKHANDDLVAFVRVHKRAMYLGAHNLYVKIHEKFPEVPEAELKLDGNVAVKLVDEGFAAVLAVLVTGASQSRQHVITSLIHIESRKSPTAVLFDVDTGRFPPSL
ncbi:hypothetical protein Tco_1015937 [Tanacetum coccineum]|uniref:Transposase (Putative), gypsy type n=1 Tax=Tanacetum coccineum TaxID=301880 RepID=A0ABQ5FMA5_9ASTR